MTRKSTLRTGIVAGLMTLAMLLSTAPAFAAGPGGGSSGGRGNRGGGGTETTGNNLSVPTIITTTTTSNPWSLACDGSTAMPTGTPASGYPISPSTYYYLQGTSKWQAQCVYESTTNAKATADFGDNLSGDAALKTGSPIRLEVGLLEGTLAADVTTPDVSMSGFEVYKLEPDALDRVSAYGTPATVNADGTFSGTLVTNPFKEVRVYDPSATVTLKAPDGTTSNLNMTAEINATGRVVYGYNLTVSVAGTYTLTFTAPKVDLNNPDSTADVHTASIQFTVTASSGSSGGGGSRGRNG